MNKSLLLPALLLCTGALQAQVYKADTAFTTEIVGGNKASCISKPNGANYGINQSRDAFFLIGEDFTVPANTTWNLDTVIIYAYQTGSLTSMSSISAATLQIRQNSVTGTSVFGDTTTNRMVATAWTGIYRVDTSSPGLTATNRPLMYVKIKVTPTLTLTAGNYWLIFGCKGNTLTGPWCPPKVNPGRINPAGQNGMQRTPNGWQPSKDSLSVAQQQFLGFPFILKGPQKLAVPGVNAINLLLQNQPNPFSGNTNISFTLPSAGYVKLEVYNATGQRMATLIDGKLAAGKGEATFNANGLPAGMYYYRLQTEEGMQTKTMEVLK